MSIKFIVWIVVLVAGAVFLQWSRKAVQVTEYLYRDLAVPKAFDGFRIVHVSDLQSEYFGKRQRRLLKTVRKTRPDAIVFTGDLADRNHTDYNASLIAAKGLSRIAPVYYVNGNHELSLPQEDISQMYDEMRLTGINLLFDEKIAVEKEGDCICFAGLSEETIYESKMRGGVLLSGSGRGRISDNEIDASLICDKIKMLRQGVTEKAMFVLLVHEPQFFNTYAHEKVDLIFAGHAHGGQIRLPFTQGLFAPGQGVLPKLTAGIHRKGNTAMIISRGLGNSVFPFRVFNRPEIVVTELSAEISSKNDIDNKCK